MAKRLETTDEITDFIRAGDPLMDQASFWEALELDAGAVIGFAVSMSEIYNAKDGEISKISRRLIQGKHMEPAFILLAMEFGARLALRANDGNRAVELTTRGGR